MRPEKRVQTKQKQQVQHKVNQINQPQRAKVWMSELPSKKDFNWNLNRISKIDGIRNQKRAREKLKQVQEKKRVEEEEKQRASEIERRKMGQEILKAKREKEEQELRRIAEEKRREKLEDELAKQKIRERIQQDR